LETKGYSGCSVIENKQFPINLHTQTSSISSHHPFSATLRGVSRSSANEEVFPAGKGVTSVAQSHAHTKTKRCDFARIAVGPEAEVEFSLPENTLMAPEQKGIQLYL
jgi:hypothetical protein